MMQVKRLTPDLAVGPQITDADIDTIAALGFRSIIGNRPDGEAPDQPAFASIRAAAERRGLAVRHIPIVAIPISPGSVQEFRSALRDLPRPVFAFCRTGTRSALLWALANTESLTAEERIGTAASQGYDLSALRPALEAADRGAVNDA